MYCFCVVVICCNINNLYIIFFFIIIVCVSVNFLSSRIFVRRDSSSRSSRVDF